MNINIVSKFQIYIILVNIDWQYVHEADTWDTCLVWAQLICWGSAVGLENESRKSRDHDDVKDIEVESRPIAYPDLFVITLFRRNTTGVS